MGGWAFTPVSIIYFSAAGISFLLALVAWRLRPAKGATVFSLMMVFVGFWVTAYALDLFSTELSWKISMMKIEYIGMASAIYLWLLFVAIYTRFEAWINKPVLGILAIIPLYTVISIFKAPLSNGLHTDYHIVMIKGLSVLEKTYQGGFYIWTSFAYTAMGSGLVLLVMRIVTMPSTHRKQAYLLIPAIIILIGVNSMYIFKNNPIEPYDPTPLSLAVVGVLFMISMRKHRFIEIMPVAHNHVLKNMRSGVIICDIRNRILEINPVAEAILGYSQKAIVGKSINKILPECGPLIQSSYIYNEIKTEIELGTGGRTYELKINLLSDLDNQPNGKLLLLYDITDQKEAIRELDAYARTVAHDLKNPLNAIVGLASLIKQQGVECSDLKELSEGIVSGAMQMNSIVEGLLLLAQVRNLDNVETSKLNMKQLVLDSLERLTAQIKEKNAEVYIPEELIDGVGYNIWVEEVWVNLLSNAVKYGGETPVVEISSSVKGEKVYYSVTDNGAGLTAEEQENVFVEFNRLSKHKKGSNGHGLGLSIVKRIVKKLGGEVGVHSTPGDGSTFFFSLPIDK